MFGLPQLKRIKDSVLLNEYSLEYQNNSGLPIPETFICSSHNLVYGIYWKQELVGGFILGNEPQFRSLRCFAQQDQHVDLLQRMGSVDSYSEICCFFIQSEYRTQMYLNLFIWLSMTYVIRRYSRPKLLFGTNKLPLARLYGQTHQSRPFHEDRINDQRTFLFVADRKRSVRGMLEIIRFKLNRFQRIKKNRRHKMNVA